MCGAQNNLLLPNVNFTSSQFAGHSDRSSTLPFVYISPPPLQRSRYPDLSEAVNLFNERYSTGFLFLIAGCFGAVSRVAGQFLLLVLKLQIPAGAFKRGSFLQANDTCWMAQGKQSDASGRKVKGNWCRIKLTR